jgi:aminopeptidase
MGAIATSRTLRRPPAAPPTSPRLAYAEAIVSDVLDLREGDSFFVQAQPAHRELVVATAEAAYRAGARLVDVAYTDRMIRAARLRYGSDGALGVVPSWTLLRSRRQLAPRAATLGITGDDDLDALNGIPPERLAQDLARAAAKLRPYQTALGAGRLRWAAAAWPTTGWARRVYPQLAATPARERLLNDLLHFCRLDDGPEEARRHLETLRERALLLTRLRLVELEVRARGTALRLALPRGARFLGGRHRTSVGRSFTPNFPTEEVYTSPHRYGVEGEFRSSRPVVYLGRAISDLSGEIRGGRLVRVSASREEDRDFFATLVRRHRGGSRVGEVALVDASSRIAQANRIYFNTLVDENAVAHIAFGAAFPMAAAAAARATLNQSSLHVDVPIGDPALEVRGRRSNGELVPLIVEGRWALPADRGTGII